MLHDKLAALHRSQADGPRSHAFPRPSFKVRRGGATAAAPGEPRAMAPAPPVAAPRAHADARPYQPLLGSAPLT